MFLELITIILLSTVPACFNYFLDYCLGKPMSNEPSRKAIFSSYSIRMAERRLKKMGLLYNLRRNFEKMLEKDAPIDVIEANKDQRQLVTLLEGQKYYKYEQALGMCPYCTNFWVSLFFAIGLFFTLHFQFIPSVTLLVLIPIFSHSILRKL